MTHLRPILLAAACSLSLVACGRTESVEEVEASEVQLPVADVTAATGADEARDALVGRYVRQDAEGRTTSLALAADDTYIFTSADGTKNSGRFERDADGRIRVSSIGGAPAYFEFRDDRLVPLDSLDQPDSEVDEAAAWMREGAAPAAEAGATSPAASPTSSPAAGAEANESPSARPTASATPAAAPAAVPPAR